MQRGLIVPSSRGTGETRQGRLQFSASKDSNPGVWRPHTIFYCVPLPSSLAISPYDRCRSWCRLLFPHRTCKVPRAPRSAPMAAAGRRLIDLHAWLSQQRAE